MVVGAGSGDWVFDLAWRFFEGASAGLGLKLTGGQRCPESRCEVHCADCPSCPVCPACKAGEEWWLLLFVVVFLVAYWLGSLVHSPRSFRPAPEVEFEPVEDIRAEALAQFALVRDRRHGAR
jgi:hypothetical protein